MYFVFTEKDGNKLRFVTCEGLEGDPVESEGFLELGPDGRPLRGVVNGEPTPPKRILESVRSADGVLADEDVVEDVKRALPDDVSVERVRLCGRCLGSGRVTVVEKPYRLGRLEVCRRCALEALEEEIAFRYPRYSPSLVEKMERVLRRIRDVDTVVEMFDPAFDPSRDTERTRWRRVEGEEEKWVKLDRAGVPDRIRAILRRLGYERLNPVQVACIEEGLFDGENLLVVSPTGSGKTLVGVMAGLRVLTEGRRFVYLVPLVALANQKFGSFRRELGDLGYDVALAVGASRIKEFRTRRPGADPREADVIVGTYEAFDLLLRTGALDPGEIGAVVIDEVHTLRDEERGPELDGLICRLRELAPEAQIIGLSATVGNPGEVAGLLGARVVEHDRRPVPLEFHLVLNQDRRQKWERIASLVEREWDTVYSTGYRGQTIVFTYSRRRTHKLAEYLADRTGLDVRPYHGGLPYGRRKETEKAFERGEVAAVVATAALGAGVDFPASQVVFESLAMGIEWITPMEFLQMAGRAGRPGYHDVGKVYLMVEPGRRYHRSQDRTEDEVAFELLEAEVEDVEVVYDDGDEREQVLAHVASRAARDVGSLKRVVSRSLGFATDPVGRIRELEETGFLTSDGSLSATDDGRIAVRYFVDPLELRGLAEAKGNPIDAVCRVHPFDGFMLSEDVRRAVRRSMDLELPKRFEDALSILYHEGKTALERIPPKVKDRIVNTIRELDCGCEAFPDCEHVVERASRIVLEERVRGTSVYAIPRRLSDRYCFTAYPTDLAEWLEGVVRLLEGAGKLAGDPGKKAAAEALADPWASGGRG